MIIISPKLLKDIYRHVRQSYPHECCGVLSGKRNPHKEIFVSHPVTNLNTERTHDRYQLDPQQFQRIDDQVRTQGLSVLGFYHSHPDHPPAPSEFDTQRAWEGYSYLIVAIKGGKTLQAKSWVLNEQGVFEEERIVGNAQIQP